MEGTPVLPHSLLKSSFLLQASKCPEGTKPMLVFAGEAFDTDNEHKRLKSLLIGIHQLYSVNVFLSFRWKLRVFVLLLIRVLFLVFQTSSEVPLCLRCVWQVWNMFCTSLPWMGKSTCAATGKEVTV